MANVECTQLPHQCEFLLLGALSVLKKCALIAQCGSSCAPLRKSATYIRRDHKYVKIIMANSQEMFALEVRQEALLERLRHLKQQLDQLQGNKGVSSTVTPTAPVSVIGAAAHSSPLKMSLQEKQAVVLHVMTVLGDHLADLNGLHFDRVVQDKVEKMVMDARRQHESVLFRLNSLKAELDRLAVARKAIVSSCESISVAEQQRCILGVIKALKEELKFLSELKKKVDPEECSLELDVASHHREVVGKLKLLQEELAKMLKGLQDLSWETAVVHDLVISANPDMPPFSLVLLRKFLREAGWPVYSVNHLHSSVVEVSDFLQRCFTDQPLGDRNKHKLAFTLHWKDVPAPNLMVNPLRQTQISGEANIIRYISRLFPLSSPYNYEASGTFTAITETDQLLDQLMKQLANGNNKERQAMLRQLNGRLGKSTWLLGDTCSIVDVLAWSLVKQARLDSGAAGNVAKWYKSVSMLGDKDLEPEDSKLQELPKTEKSNMEKGKGVNTAKTPQDSKKPVSKESTGEGNQKNHIGRVELETYLKTLDIAYQVKDHEEVFTVDALMNCVKDMPGLHMKNLFLKDKKKNLYLLSAQHNAEVKLNEVGKQISVKDLRFGDESVMFDVLGVKQGCVTPYALVNDSSHQVKFLLDQEALNEAHPFVNFHPMSNAATLGISPKDFSKFLDATSHKPTLLTFK
ncbi:uncharacterized protein [Panulirus ornatus]|uniref:uncharacterized protein isoform X4 n=1 Tax=Panulirus ornatus TaxID=150431 RepID=UPI003A8BC91C